jgi:G:T-mismatch repair DNA endonuclease (very short patch repair protein)
MVIRTCENCGKECKVPPTKERYFHYCSNACLSAARSSTIQCAQCGKPVHVVNARKGRTRFCSKQCADTFYRRGEMQTRICPICGTEFETTAGKIRARVTCSKQCETQAHLDGVIKARGMRTKESFVRPSSKVEIHCQVCGKSIMVPPCRVAIRKTCSRTCYGKLVTATRTGTVISSEVVTCAACGKSVRKFKCRIKQGSHTFCNMRCYLASNQSGLEDKVARWMQQHGVPYKQQAKIGRFNVDFMVGSVIVEANGCYWHGCPEHNPPRNTTQTRRTARDAHLARYCAYHDIQLITIWEHDVEHDDYSTLFPLL